MRYIAFFILAASFLMVAAHAVSAEEWQFEAAQSAVNSGMAKAHFIDMMAVQQSAPSPEKAERIPAPRRYVEREPTFSPMRDNAQQDPAFRRRPMQPLDATALIKNFAGISYHGSSPSDTTIAVGAQQVAIAVNTSLAVYLKGGGKLAQRNFTDFFADFTEVQGADFFDPKLAYDQYSGHFIFNVDAYRDSDGRSWYMFVVSKTSDVRDGWIGWALDMRLNGTGKTALWADYPGVGYDSQGIYLTANMFNAKGTFQYAKLRILRKSDVYAFKSDLGWYDFWQLHDATGPKTFTVQPVRSYGTVGVEYLVSANSYQGAAVTLWSVSNVNATPQLSKKRINVPSFKVSLSSADQRGGGSVLDVSDARLSDAVFRDGSIYVGHTIQKDWGSGFVSASRIYTLSAGGTLQQSMTFGADGAYYYYPAMTTDAKGNLILVFDRSSSDEFAGVRFAVQPAGASTFQPSSQLKAGMSNYFWSPDQFGMERWGDYSGIANDPDGSVWIHSQYADSPSKEWTGRVGRLRY